MLQEKLSRIIEKKQSLLCVGLDPDIEKIPEFLRREANPLETFNREIISATADFAAAFKPNIAFYESLGTAGWHLLEKTLERIPPDVLTIADAKRADIGNTSRKYAETFFQTFQFDAITVSPYMGLDSILPFLEFKDRGVFILCLTSNKGARDFQYLETEGQPLYLHVAKKVVSWNQSYGNCGLVVGATHSGEINRIRQLAKKLAFLIPGVGAQGGVLEKAVIYGTDEDGGMALFNVSRGILYASPKKDFAIVANRKARELRDQINTYRSIKNQKINRGFSHG